MRFAFAALLVGSLVTTLGGPPAAAQDVAAVGMAHTPSGNGAWTLFADGTVETLGDAPDHGNLPAVQSPDYIGVAATPDGRGLWGVRENGTVETLGDAPGFAAEGPQPCLIVGVAATPSGDGLWLLHDDGGVTALGDAAHFGDAAGSDLTFADIAPTPSGKGYFLTAETGEVRSFGPGGGPHIGDFKAVGPNSLVATAATPDGRGLWGLRDDGTVETLGDAPDLGDGSADAPFSDLTPTPSGNGYRLLVETGEVQSFGDAVGDHSRDGGSPGGPCAKCVEGQEKA